MGQRLLSIILSSLILVTLWVKDGFYHIYRYLFTDEETKALSDFLKVTPLVSGKAFN